MRRPFLFSFILLVFVPTTSTLFLCRIVHIYVNLAHFMIYMRSMQQSQQFGKSSWIASFTNLSMFCSNTSSLKLFNVSAHSILIIIYFTDKV